MPFREGKLEILFVLLVHIAIWSLSTSLPAKAAQLSPWSWDDDDDDFWFRRSTTRKPYIWERYTVSPDNYEYKPSSSGVSPLFWIILIAVLVLIFIIYIARYFCNTESSTYESSATLHPPPASIVLPPNRLPQNTRTSNLPPSGGAEYNFTAWSSSGVPSTHNAGDKPPGYSEVVMSDFTEDSAKFPDVCPKPLETPPPKYDNESLMRF